MSPVTTSDARKRNAERTPKWADLFGIDAGAPPPYTMRGYSTGGYRPHATMHPDGSIEWHVCPTCNQDTGMCDHTEPTDQETPMPSPTQRRHDELRDLLTEIRDRLPEPFTYTVDLVKCRGVATTPEPVDVTEEPPVGSQVTDSDGDVWERRDGWRLWMGPHRGEWTSLGDGAAWWRLREGAPLRLTTDADRERVGLPVDTAPDVDPDEALALVLWQYLPDMDEEWAETYADESNVTKHQMQVLARAAREHIEAERDVRREVEREAAEGRIDALERAAVAQERRAEKAESDVERLTRERDEARGVAKSHVEDARDWRRRYAALRVDVVGRRDFAREQDDGKTSGILGRILRRDTERGRDE